MEAELSRFAREIYERWGIRHQGQISRTILIPDRSYAEDPIALLYEVYHFPDALHLLPGEYSIAAHVSRCVESYIAAVHDGGHQAALMRGVWDPLFVKFCAAGLQWMGCAEHAAIFANFVQLVRTDLGLAARVWRCDPTAEWRKLRTLDEAIFSLSLHDQIRQQADWLRSTGDLRILAADDLKTAMRELEKQSKLRRSREHLFSRARHLASPGHAIIQLADRLGGLAQKNIGRKWVASARLLSDIEFGADPIPVRFWENDWSLLSRDDLAIYRIVLVPGSDGREPTAVLYQDWRELARAPLKDELFQRACVI